MQVFPNYPLYVAKKDIEIQPGFEPGSSEFRSDALTNELLELGSVVEVVAHTTFLTRSCTVSHNLPH